jgi:hypothetical protein
MPKLTVLEKEIAVQSQHDADYISLTDIARYKSTDHTDDLIRNWIRNRNTIEFLGIKQWIEATAAIGIVSKAGRYGGTFAHKDIAFEFASWISVEFRLYLIKEFQRLKDDEQKQLGWDIRRNLTKINYRIHTDAIKENLIPPKLTPHQTNLIYASEADVLNMALFGMTAKQWRDAHPGEKGNIRDHADMSQLVCLSNLENLNALFIREQMPQAARLTKLNQIAIQQMRILSENPVSRQLGAGNR